MGVNAQLGSSCYKKTSPSWVPKPALKIMPSSVFWRKLTALDYQNADAFSVTGIFLQAYLIYRHKENGKSEHRAGYQLSPSTCQISRCKWALWGPAAYQRRSPYQCRPRHRGSTRTQVEASPIFSGHVRVKQWSDFFGRGPIFSGHRSWNV